MRHLLAWLTGVLLFFGTVMPAGAFWGDADMIADPRVRAVVKHCVPTFPEFAKIKKIWMDNDNLIIFIDHNDDGILDYTHVHIMDTSMKGYYCTGQQTVSDAMKYIDHWYKLHSI